MNPDQQNRLEIVKALGKDFPDHLLEDLIDVARYVEGGGIDRAREGSQDSTAKYPDEADDISEPRTWAHLEDIPAHVRAVTDSDGDVIRRVALGDRLVWKFEAERYEYIIIANNFAPFTEVLS